MIFFEKSFTNVKSSKNPEKINDFLIELSKNPHKEHVKYLDYFIKHLEPHIFDKIKLNLIYLIGEIGDLIALEDKYLKLLIDTYYNSDRWVRNEIMQAMKKITLNTEVNEEIIKLIGYAINDEYQPIRVNSLKILLNLKENPLFIRRNLFLALNSKDLEVEELCVKIFEKFLPDFNELFNSLDYSNNYTILKPKAIRSLLLICFKSIINLESFRKRILSSNWELTNKEKYLKEIDIYEKLLLKKI
ncbi:MAG: hypothetical protein ACFFDF_18415 [Candidatus Odinarchaeota archaeon]